MHASLLFRCSPFLCKPLHRTLSKDTTRAVSLDWPNPNIAKSRSAYCLICKSKTTKQTKLHAKSARKLVIFDWNQQTHVNTRKASVNLFLGYNMIKNASTSIGTDVYHYFVDTGWRRKTEQTIYLACFCFSRNFCAHQIIGEIKM